MSYGQKHLWRQPVYGQGPTAATAPPPAPPPPAASATSVPQRQQPPPQTTSVPPAPWLDASCASKLNPSGPTNVPFYLPDDVILATVMPDDGFTFQPPGMDQEDWRRMELDFVQPSRPWSTLSSVSVSSVSAASSAGSSFSPVQTDASETATVLGHSREPSPQKHPPFISSNANSTSGRTAESTEERVYPCDWAGCGHKQKRVYATHGELVWHVKAEHLLVCPASGCVEGPFGSARMVAAHLAVAHPEIGAEVVKEWQLEPTAPSEGKTTTKRAEPVPTKAVEQQPQEAARVVVESGFDYLASKKRRCREQLQSIVERRIKRARKSSESQSSDGQTSQTLNSFSAPSFPLVWEHAVLPFLIELIPRWSTPRHVISTTRGRTPDLRRINITTQVKMSRIRKIIVAKHVLDLLPDTFRGKVSFIFSVGDVVRSTWARGLGKDLPDDICHPKNPYLFRSPCIGDSIGIKGTGSVEDSTATLGPCISVDGGSYWLGNFHPFLEAYQTLQGVKIEHPSPQDRYCCIEQAHDSLSLHGNFDIGNLMVTSGLNLKTTRVSHDPYWEDMGKEPPLVVTDWALISSPSANANILRRFPSDTQAPVKEPLIKSTTAIIPGAPVVSSGRTSGYQRGQICEIPAYVSGEENGTQKATREWFIEEPYPCDNEEAWIRGGIGVEGDSGAAVVDADTNALVGQVWGRNRYWGPGPRHTFFTPIADIFDDIQEKCGQQTRPQLPQHRDEADRYPVYPSCRQCYDLRTYLDSRRSSRMSLQSMIMGRGDCDQDITSTEAASELATPGDYGPRGMFIEEMGASFNNVFSPGQLPYVGAATPLIADLRSPYAQTLELDDVQATAATPGAKKRSPASPTSDANTERSSKRVKGQTVGE